MEERSPGDMPCKKLWLEEPVDKARDYHSTSES